MKNIGVIQAYAILDWAKNEGSHWKARLRRAWESGNYPSHASQSALQTVRNTAGPSWLARVRLDDLRKVANYSN